MIRLSDSIKAITLHECNYKVYMYSIYVMVHGCLPLSPTGLPSDGCQAHAGLVTSATLLTYAMQMVAPRATIGSPPSNWCRHLHGHCTCTPHLNFL